VDSIGIGFHLCERIRELGFATEGINVACSAIEPERFSNAKAERFWRMRERFERGDISGRNDDMLAELAALNYIIDSRGRTAIEDKTSARSALGRSPDLAEALMLGAIGEPRYGFAIPELVGPLPGTTSHSLEHRNSLRDTCAAMDAEEDFEREPDRWLTRAPGPARSNAAPLPRFRPTTHRILIRRAKGESCPGSATFLSIRAGNSKSGIAFLVAKWATRRS
jgi:hypothetical protein